MPFIQWCSTCCDDSLKLNDGNKFIIAFYSILLVFLIFFIFSKHDVPLKYPITHSTFNDWPIYHILGYLLNRIKENIKRGQGYKVKNELMLWWLIYPLSSNLYRDNTITCGSTFFWARKASFILVNHRLNSVSFNEFQRIGRV